MKTKISINRLAPAFASVLLAVVLTGCYKEAQQKEQTTNSEFNLELLFEKDGCKIYRFSDGGHAVYWTDCRGKVESVYTQSSGKSSHEVRVQNETVVK